MLCRFCRTDVSDDAQRCPHCTTWLRANHPARREWYRRNEGKMIAGVATGLAEQFDLPLAFVRLLFVLSLFLGGGGLVVYCACWLVMPLADSALNIRPGVGTIGTDGR